MVKHEVLKYLEDNKGKLISGGDISRSLNVSRTAVWKAVNSLKNEGHIIESLANEGYRLNLQSNVISEYAISSELTTKVLAREIEVFDIIDSTNIYVKKKAQEGAKEGYTVIAKEQTKARGRRGRSFFSPKETGIYMTILLRPRLNISQLIFVTVSIAVAVAEAIDELLGINTEIKWVNDILYKGKKLCGILSEASVESENGNVEYIAVGVGINVNTQKSDFPEEIQQIATSLSQVTDKNIDKNLLVAKIMNKFEILYFELINGSKETTLLKYKQRLCMLGEYIRVHTLDGSYKAKAVDINANAELVVEVDGKKHILNSGEISIRKEEEQ